jgi:hypothetical protein
MKFLFFTISLLTLLACSGKKTATQDKAANPTTTNAEPEPPIAIAADKLTNENGNVASAGKWLYEKTTDHEGNPVYKASTTSPTVLEFEFPYNGGSTATLIIRKRESGTHVYIQVSKGQFNRSFQGGQARVRFDNSPPVNYAFSAAENGSANVIFFDSEKAIIDKLKKARNMVVDVQFAGQGNRQIAFRTTGLVWNH